MSRYQRNTGRRAMSLKILMPTESQEEINQKWEAELLEVFHFSMEEVEKFKQVRSAKQFLEYCEINGITFNIDLD